MPELGGIVMMIGGGMMTASSYAMHRMRRHGTAAELLGPLDATPLPIPDPALDSLMADAAAALDTIA